MFMYCLVRVKILEREKKGKFGVLFARICVGTSLAEFVKIKYILSSKLNGQ